MSESLTAITNNPEGLRRLRGEIDFGSEPKESAEAVKRGSATEIQAAGSTVRS